MIFGFSNKIMILFYYYIFYIIPPDDDRYANFKRKSDADLDKCSKNPNKIRL